MDRIAWKQQITAFLSKYKYVLLILCVGIILMNFPNQSAKELADRPAADPIESKTTAEELTEILSHIQGVGKVRVMLTEAAGAETIYQTDEDRSQSADLQSVRVETVLISVGNEDQGLVRTVTPPVYLGAIVVCQGGGDPAVRLSVAKAVSSVTGIGTDRITVLKMK